MNDVKGSAIAKCPQEFPGQFLSIVSNQLWCGACHTNVGSAKYAVQQHTEGKKHLPKVHSKIAGSERGPKIIECIAAYKDSVKESTDGQEPVGFERVPGNVQVYQIISYYLSKQTAAMTRREYGNSSSQ